jgi:hypothetical protein
MRRGRMMDAVDPREDARRKRGRFAGIVSVVTIFATTMLSGTRFRDWQWALWLVSFTVIIVVTTFSMRRIGPPYRRGGGGGGSRPGRRGGDGGDGALIRGDVGPDGPAVYQRRTLLMVSRMMPGSAGHRWLAEAESLLSEIAAARRGAAVRSYLLSAPRLMAMLWARELLRVCVRGRSNS